MKAKWTYSGDVNMLDYGGQNVRQGKAPAPDWIKSQTPVNA